MKKRCLAIICLVALAGLPSCSSSGGSSLKNQVENDIDELLGLMALALNFLNPFPVPAPQSASPTGIPVCQDVDLPTELGCEPNTGPVQECPPIGEDISVIFNGCAFSTADGTVAIDGTAIYSPGQDWPRGDKIVQVIAVDLDWTYDITLTGTDQVMIHAVDNIDGTMADCMGSLDTERSTCEIIDTQL